MFILNWVLIYIDMSWVSIYVNGIHRTAIHCQDNSNGIKIVEDVKSAVATNGTHYRQVFVRYKTSTESVGSFYPDAYKPSLFRRSREILAVNVITARKSDARPQ